MFNSHSKVDRLMNKGTYTGLMLTGDFNQSSTSWDNLGFPTTSKKSETRFTNFVKSSNLFQHVDCPTFLMPGCEAKSISDLIFTKKPNRIDNLATDAPLADLRRRHISLSFDFILNSWLCDDLQFKTKL